MKQGLDKFICNHVKFGVYDIVWASGGIFKCGKCKQEIDLAHDWWIKAESIDWYFLNYGNSKKS